MLLHSHYAISVAEKHHFAFIEIIMCVFCFISLFFPLTVLKTAAWVYHNDCYQDFALHVTLKPARMCMICVFSHTCIRNSLENSNRCPKCNCVIDKKDDIFPNFLREFLFHFSTVRLYDMVFMCSGEYRL